MCLRNLLGKYLGYLHEKDVFRKGYAGVESFLNVFEF